MGVSRNMLYVWIASNPNQLAKSASRMTVDYIEFGDYSADNESQQNVSVFSTLNVGGKLPFLTPFLVAVNVLVCVVGLAGNSLVIWICGWKMKRTVITTWYLSLAVSDLLFCALLPLEVAYTLTSHWPFGQALCKLVSSALFFNMFSSVFLLVLISADRCVLTCFPVWSRNRRTVRGASAAVALMWMLSALLTLPSLAVRQTALQGDVVRCYVRYTAPSKHKAVALSRFLCGFLVPFLAIVWCSAVLTAKLRGMSIRSGKPYKIMAALIFCFFVCWVPYHTFVLLELNVKKVSLESLQTGMRVGTTLAAANSFLSPVLYIFIGNDFNQMLRRSVTERWESVMDVRTGPSQSVQNMPNV
ncbi:chemerin-like receptor 1 [Syngnathus scovelli]|uniref:chemerin-like receptor 1 n=1 Tax=Syngnathus scovelli TaxID=161590 RepID=UPI00210F28CC|nr:chemerin-like receptor 1 [Syngnathus scovelli]